ncbi:hypothetical protein [Gimesia aquarii]|nr:hypothetical protein [Gimesia aquarii]
MKFYVVRDTEEVAADIRNAEAGLRSIPENGDNSESGNESQAIAVKEVRE